mgnify:CR=1 FL=1
MRQSAKRRMRNAGKHRTIIKYLMGGIVAKYFPECYQYEEKELNVILSAALASAECRQAVENVKRMEKNADEMEDEKDRNGGHADETKTKENRRRIRQFKRILRVAVFRRECKQYLREYGFIPVMGCAQIDHTPYGLVRSPRHLRWALPALHQSRGEITFPLRPLRFLPLCILCICP